MAAGVKISVCMATYQGERFIEEQLDSILQQLRPHDEVIVSDDGSTDGTLGRIKAYKDARIRILQNDRNLGYSKNFERALIQASGDIIFIADQDDVWLPDKVSTMLVSFKNHDMVVSDVTIVAGDLSQIERSHFQHYGVRTGFLRNLLKTRYIGAAMAMHRNVLDVLVPIPSRSNLCAYDYWIAVVSELYFDVGLVNRPLMLYRRHEGTASTGGSRSVYTLSHRLLVRAYTLYHLSKLARRRHKLSDAVNNRSSAAA
jgi:glycosyltransferase involved in cell wall biosynthesis